MENQTAPAVKTTAKNPTIAEKYLHKAVSLVAEVDADGNYDGFVPFPNAVRASAFRQVLNKHLKGLGIVAHGVINEAHEVSIETGKSKVGAARKYNLADIFDIATGLPTENVVSIHKGDKVSARMAYRTAARNATPSINLAVNFTVDPANAEQLLVTAENSNKEFRIKSAPLDFDSITVQKRTRS